jgi:hypothetical protein
VAASNFGLDRAPAWFLNLRAHPEAEFRTRAGVERVVSRELTDSERDELGRVFWKLIQCGAQPRPALSGRSLSSLLNVDRAEPSGATSEHSSRRGLS